MYCFNIDSVFNDPFKDNDRMKANAPEKIYVAETTFPDYVDFDGSPINTKRIDDTDIEYARTDAFIEKAGGWIEENIKKWHENIKVHGFRGMTPLMINEFKNYMKKIILLTLTALMMVGCDIKQPDGTYVPSVYRTYTIDSCEYVGYAVGCYQSNYLAHKGNCRFCKERRQKELEELVIKLKEK